MATSNIPHVEFLKNKKLAIEFEIISLEDLFSRAGKIVPTLNTPHRLRFHNILYITAGGGTHEIDFEPYPFNEGSLIFVSRGQVQAFDVRPGIKGYLLLFTTDFLEKNLIHSDVVSLYRFYNYHLHAPIIHAQKTREEGIHDLVKEIKREYCNPNHFLKEENLRHFLKVLMLKVERNKRTLTSDQKKAEWLVRFGIFNEHLEKHIASTRSVKDFAEKVNMSPKHLNTICKSVSGMTAKQYIDSFMILEIKRILATSDSPMQEISDNLGFEESTNFVKYFKKHSGVSPSKFRKIFTR